ncbi:DUF3426 domain-containing protein [Pelagibius sp.]|uniref:DUF3426 domain-containing protein n=1 Tax=Pelagibius sp. TaxID=1931238 RepID=UPI002610FE88|nr:DUF3426 domain-containing protein [Pelagibius sp.]
MIVTCPACGSRFAVEREHLGYDGRIVRCGKCGNCWHQMPEEEPPAAAPEPAEPPPPPPPLPKRRAAPAKAKARNSAGLGWLALLAVLVALFAGAWFGREQIVAQFPQFETLYATLGVPVTAPGPTLELRVGEPRVTQRDGDSIILLSGSVTNITDRKQTVPKLRARLTDGEGAVLREWEFEAPRAELDAGAAVDFATETVDPPAEGQNLTITFVQDEE